MINALQLYYTKFRNARKCISWPDRGAPASAPYSPKFSEFHVVFLKIWHNRMLAAPGGSAPLPTANPGSAPEMGTKHDNPSCSKHKWPLCKCVMILNIFCTTTTILFSKYFLMDDHCKKYVRIFWSPSKRLHTSKVVDPPLVKF